MNDNPNMTSQTIEPIKDSPASQPDVMTQWIALSLLQKNFFMTLTAEVQETSDVVENSAIGLSHQFQSLSHLALEQNSRISDLVDNMSNIEIDDQVQDYQNIINSMNRVLEEMVSSIVLFSKEAMRLVFTLEEVNKDVCDMSKALENIDHINKQTHYLAINAAIEAKSSRSNGQQNSFDIIAQEIKELSNNTSQLSEQVKDKTKRVSEGINGTYSTLQKIADTNLDPQIEAKKYIDKAIRAIVDNSNTQSDIMRSALGTNEEISKLVGRLTMTMQFQDFSKQKLQHVDEALTFLMNAIDKQLSATCDQDQNLNQSNLLDHYKDDVLFMAEEFLDDCGLSKVKDKFITNIKGENEFAEQSKNAYTTPSNDLTENDNDIELF